MAPVEGKRQQSETKPKSDVTAAQAKEGPQASLTNTKIPPGLEEALNPTQELLKQIEELKLKLQSVIKDSVKQNITGEQFKTSFDQEEKTADHSEYRLPGNPEPEAILHLEPEVNPDSPISSFNSLETSPVGTRNAKKMQKARTTPPFPGAARCTGPRVGTDGNSHISTQALPPVSAELQQAFLSEQQPDLPSRVSAITNSRGVKRKSILTIPQLEHSGHPSTTKKKVTFQLPATDQPDRLSLGSLDPETLQPEVPQSPREQERESLSPSSRKEPVVPQSSLDYVMESTVPQSYAEEEDDTGSTIETQGFNTDLKQSERRIPLKEEPVAPESNQGLDSSAAEPTMVNNTADQCNMGSRLNRPRDLTVSAQLNGQHIKLLVDTGAGTSVIDAQFATDIFQGSLPELKRSPLLNLKTVSGEELPVLGKLNTTLRITEGDYPYELQVVKNLTYEAVLGRDFLRANGAVINLRDGTLQLAEPPHPVMKGQFPVRILNTCVIPPSSETVLPVGVDVSIQPGSIGLIENTEHLMDRYQLRGAAAIVTTTADRTVPYRVVNPLSTPVTLYKGANIGTFTSIDQDLQIFSLDVEPPKEQAPNTETADVPVDLSDTDMTEPQKKQLQMLLNEYRDIFAQSSKELGKTDWVQHVINTGDAAPIRQRPYRVPQAQKARIEKCIDEMLEQGVVRPSNSPWASPVVLVKKPDGSDRFCVDFRAVNSVTRKSSYPLPRIGESLESLSGSAFFSCVDLQNGYWQILLEDDSKEKTAFITHAGLYEFNVMAFGLCGAPADFQRLMERVLRGLNWKIALIYLDDVLIFSCTFEDHLQHLRLVFDRFRASGLKLKPKKCFFGKRTVKYLGHVVSKDGVQPDPSKIKVIQDYPVPRRVKDVRAFLGLANYY